MEERVGIVAVNGKPMTLIGKPLKEGDLAPDFEVLNHDLSPIMFASFRGKVCVLSAVPSLDTP